jgi:hypothetical protein
MSDARNFLEQIYAADTDECLIWPFSTRNGYGQIMLRRRLRYVHEIACEYRHGPRPPGTEVAHGPCHNRRCFNPRHLSWKTPAQNQADKRRDGTLPHGETHVFAKLTETKVREIRERYRTGEWTQRGLARAFDVSQSTVRDVLGKGRNTWRHL